MNFVPVQPIVYHLYGGLQGIIFSAKMSLKRSALDDP